MDWTEAPAVRRKPPANGYSPILPPPRHVSTLPDSYLTRGSRWEVTAGLAWCFHRMMNVATLSQSWLQKA